MTTTSSVSFTATVVRSRWVDLYAPCIALVSIIGLVCMLYTPVIPMTVWRFTHGLPDLWWWTAVVVFILGGRRLPPKVSPLTVTIEGDRIRVGATSFQLRYARFAEPYVLKGIFSVVIEFGGWRPFRSHQLQISGRDTDIADLTASIRSALAGLMPEFRLKRGTRWQAAAASAPFLLGGFAFALVPRLGYPLQAAVVLPWAIAATVVVFYPFDATLSLGPNGVNVRTFEGTRTYRYDEIREVRRNASQISLLLKTGKTVRLARCASQWELDHTHEASLRLEVLGQLLNAKLAAMLATGAIRASDSRGSARTAVR